MHKNIRTTKDKIIDSYWELIEKNSLNVSNICKRANINRSTFYQYYLDILDLSSKEEERVIKEIMDQIDTAFPTYIPKDLEEFTKVAIGVFTNYSEKIYLILKHNPLDFQAKMNEALSKRLSKVLHINTSDIHFKYIMVYIVSNICSMINSWYTNQKELSVEEMVEMIYNLMFNGLLGYTNK